MYRFHLKRGLQVLADIYFFNVAFLLALLLRFEGIVPGEYIDMYQDSFIWMSAAFILGCFIFRLYNRLWSYASIHDALVLVVAVTIASASVYGVSVAMGITFPRSIYLISWFLSLMFLSGYRLGFRLFKVYRTLGLKKLVQDKIMGRLMGKK